MVFIENWLFSQSCQHVLPLSVNEHENETYVSYSLQFCTSLPCCLNRVYYMHNKEIWRFLNKLDAIITSGLRRFISSKEIFPPSRFYFFNAIVLCEAREHLTYCFDVTSIVCQQRSECKTLESEETLKWRSHKYNNLMRSKCLYCTLAFLVVLSR